MKPRNLDGSRIVEMLSGIQRAQKFSSMDREAVEILSRRNLENLDGSRIY